MSEEGNFVSMMLDSRDQLSTHDQCRKFLTAALAPGRMVLDVGSGNGSLMKELASMGFAVSGIEIDPALIEACREEGLDVREGRAESLPFPDESMDAVVCSVVLPYTDERAAVEEWVRVLRPGGVVNASGHGLGYGVRYLVRGPGLKTRFYGLRMLANTLFYRLSGRRLPGFVGDTLCQSSGRMNAHFRSLGLVSQDELVVGRFFGFPIFLCHRAVKPVPASAAFSLRCDSADLKVAGPRNLNRAFAKILDRVVDTSQHPSRLRRRMQRDKHPPGARNTVALQMVRDYLRLIRREKFDDALLLFGRQSDP